MKRKHKLFLISAVFVLFLCLFWLISFYGTNIQEIKKFPELSLIVIYKKIPLYGSTVELVRYDGELIASKRVSDSVCTEFINVVGDQESIVVLSGESDWVWPSSLWK